MKCMPSSQTFFLCREVRVSDEVGIKSHSSSESRVADCRITDINLLLLQFFNNL